MNLDLNLFVPQTMYRRSGLECYLCQSRKKLIQKTPEEKVRQSLIRYLVEELKTPSDRISAEVPMSYYLNGASGRADIIVDDKKGKPVLLIECKEVNQIFLDDAIVQAKRYNKIVQANAIMVTNGQLCHYFLFDERNQTYKELSKIPSYKNLTKWKWFNFSSQKNNTILRPVFRSPIPQLQIDHYIQEGWVGEETNPLLYSIIFYLRGWMFDWEDKIKPTSFKSINVIEDAGIRKSQFGNAGGGTFGGEYRYFILKDENDNNQIISLGTFGSMKTKNHPHWGNRKGVTYLTVAIDDFEVSHMSLELNLDKYIDLDNHTATIWHNGTLTVGKLGQVSRQDVIKFIKSEAPQLINGADRILLGSFNLEKEIKSSQEQTINFLERLILYSLLRDKYRKMIKKGRKPDNNS